MNEATSYAERLVAIAKNCMIKNDASFMQKSEANFVKYMKHTSPKDYGISIQGKRKKHKRR